MLTRLLLLGTILLNTGAIDAQDLSTLGSQGFRLSGSLGFDLAFYDADGIAPRRDRFAYLVSAGLSPQAGGLSAPFSATFSQQETTFLQPFNQYGLSPSYKWVKAHLGYRNLTFSPLTLNGHIFLGAGIELTPTFEKLPVQFELSAMYGRLRRPVEPVDALIEGVASSYRRMGYGAKLNVVQSANRANFIGFSALRAFDVLGSIEDPVDLNGIKPQDNLVLGINGQYQLFEGLLVSAEYATSALTRDVRIERSLQREGGVFNLFDGYFTQRVSTQFRDALRTAVDYSFGNYKIGARFNNIAPDYTTLGAYFFVNDVREYTLNAAALFNDGKINVSGSIGLQHNNLDAALNTGQRRIIGSLNYNQTFTDRLSAGLSYSNYASSVLVQREELSDSLNVYQVSTSYTGVANYKFDAKGRSGLSLQLGHQLANARDEYSISETTTAFYNAAISYRTLFERPGISLHAGFTYTLNESEALGISTLGPVLGVGKFLLDKKLNLRYATAYRQSETFAGGAFSILTHRISLNYKVFKNHTLRTSFNYLTKYDGALSNRAYAETRARVGYRLRF